MLIAQISDTHLLTQDDPTKDPITGAADRRIADFSRTIEAINALETPPDLVLHTGDITQNATPAEYNLAWDMLQDLKQPVLATIGNRDRRGAFKDVFLKDGYLSATAEHIQYSVDFNGLRLIAADSMTLKGPRGELCPSRQDEVRQMLAADLKLPTLVFMHHPPVEVPALSLPMQYFEPKEAHDFMDMVAMFPQLSRILCGHTHRADMLETQGVEISIMPAVATQLRLDSYPEHRKTTPVFQLHDILPRETCSPTVEVQSRTAFVN